MGWPAPPFGDVTSSGVQTEEWIMKIAVLGADLGKNVCGIAGLDDAGLDDVGVVVARR
jgi:hypothetical protein